MRGSSVVCAMGSIRAFGVAVLLATLTVGPHAEADGSSNGWLRRDGLPDGYIEAMASSSTGFVAAGQGGIWFSTDLLAWQQTLGREQFPDPTSSQIGGIYDVSVAAAGFVAVGQALPTGGDRVVAAVWTSPDGRTWSRIESPVFDEGTAPIPAGVSTPRSSIAAVANGNAGLVAVGSTFTGKFVDGQLRSDCCLPAVWTSSDGSTWTRRAIPERRGYGPATLSDVTATPNGYLAVGGDGGHPSAWRSRDGIIWRQLPLDPSAAIFRAVAATADEVVAVGLDHDRAAIWTLESQSRWERRGAAPPARVTSFSDVVATSDGFVAVGWRGRYEVVTDALVWMSENGPTWHPVHSHGQPFAERTPLSGVVATDDAFVAFGRETSGRGTYDDPVRSTDVFWERSRP
jgi:hypothetical protein